MPVKLGLNSGWNQVHPRQGWWLSGVPISVISFHSGQGLVLIPYSTHLHSLPRKSRPISALLCLERACLALLFLCLSPSHASSSKSSHARDIAYSTVKYVYLLFKWINIQDIHKALPIPDTQLLLLLLFADWELMYLKILNPSVSWMNCWYGTCNRTKGTAGGWWRAESWQRADQGLNWLLHLLATAPWTKYSISPQF